ncbi:hypothetical protein [Phenylobacterium sp.]|uniref:hypothetical protein n=1 Tax=Phenylobacterium sp. TaxID=1871053 RepID=UPI00260C3334|nr:hypothetical protein [Phenylobacterium sp.]
MSEKTVTTTIRVTLKAWEAPNFAVRVYASTPSAGSSISSAESTGIPIREIDPDALQSMAMAWLEDLYRKAGRSCPFYPPAKMAPPECTQ